MSAPQQQPVRTLKVPSMFDGMSAAQRREYDQRMQAIILKHFRQSLREEPLRQSAERTRAIAIEQLAVAVLLDRPRAPEEAVECAVRFYRALDAATVTSPSEDAAAADCGGQPE